MTQPRRGCCLLVVRHTVKWFQGVLSLFFVWAVLLQQQRRDAMRYHFPVFRITFLCLLALEVDVVAEIATVR